MDATAILEYNLRMKFKPWQPPREEVLELQHITRRIVQLNTELTRERNRHKAASRLVSLVVLSPMIRQLICATFSDESIPWSKLQ